MSCSSLRRPPPSSPPPEYATYTHILITWWVSSHFRQENAVPQPPFALATKRKIFTDSVDLDAGSIDLSQVAPVDANADNADTSGRPMLRIHKRPRLLGSPFDLSKRIETRQRKSRRLIDEDEEGDSGLHESDLSLGSMFGEGGSDGPRRSGLPTGDIFSPQARGGRGSITFGFGSGSSDALGAGTRRASLRGIGGRMRPAWLLSPEEDMHLE